MLKDGTLDNVDSLLQEYIYYEIKSWICLMLEATENLQQLYGRLCSHSTVALNINLLICYTYSCINVCIYAPCVLYAIMLTVSETSADKFSSVLDNAPSLIQENKKVDEDTSLGCFMTDEKTHISRDKNTNIKR